MPSWINGLLKAVIPFIPKANSLGGFWNYIIGLLLRYGGSYLYDVIKDLIRKLTRLVEQKIAKDRVDAVVDNPNATEDEIGKSYEERYNAGRK